MLTTPEIAAVESALRAARAEVERLDEAARATDGLWSFLFPSQARRQADAARATLDALTRARDGLVEAAGYDHEAVLRLVESARRLGSPGWAAAALADSTVGDAVESGAAAEAGRDWWDRNVAPRLPSAGWLKLALVVVGLVALVVLVGPLLRIVGALAPRRA